MLILFSAVVDENNRLCMRKTTGTDLQNALTSRGLPIALKPRILCLRSNKINIAAIHSARRQEPSLEVRLTAIHSLRDLLQLNCKNFARNVRLLSLSIPLIALIGEHNLERLVHA